ncbi:MAG: DUF3048 domain-containing protein [Chloroflexi bacterium]|nr:DUF3048 domain-containing protein [Chloroflexota bacterium]
MTKRIIGFISLLIFFSLIAFGLADYMQGFTTSLQPSETLTPSSGVLAADITPTSTGAFALDPAETAPTFPSPTVIPSPSSTMLPMVVPLTLNEPTPYTFGPDEYPEGYNPLTGMAVEDVSLLNRRPMVIKVTNYPRSVRPQSGLSRADIVYEYYIERGISRFIAVFYGQDAERVGPVRSGRFFDEHIFRMYDGIFVFGGADPRVLGFFLDMGRHIVNSFVVLTDRELGIACEPGLIVHLCRDEDIISYNNLFTNTSALTEFITRRNGNYRPDLTGMHFSYQAPPAGEIALNVFTRYSLFIYNKWVYSIDSGRYLRFQETIGFSDPELESYAPHLDALSGEQLAADNVVVLIAPHEYFVKTNTTEINEIHLEGSGIAYVFRDGYVFPVIWFRPPGGGALTLLSAVDEYFPLKPGTTWFQVISEESTLESSGIDWRFTFVPPEVPDEPIDRTVTQEP